jgi:uncharacterized protein (TIGR02117 family)
MGVQSAAPERRKLKRPRLATALALLLGFLLYLYAPMPAPQVAPATPGDCVELHLWTNGFHTDIAAPAEIFPAAHPLRRLYPDARVFLIGWGEEGFYRADAFSFWRGLDAIVPPSPSVMHIAYNAPAAARYLGPIDDVAVPVSREGAARFVAYVDRTLTLDASGQPILVAPGKLVGRSSFLRARGSFHLFNVCNQWMARALRAAGLNVNARAAWMGDSLVEAARRERAAGCSRGT